LGDFGWDFEIMLGQFWLIGLSLFDG